MKKFILDFLEFKKSQLISGDKNYLKFSKENFKLKTVEIKNKKLALELEKECDKLGRFLTYSEFLNIDQFGEYGYHKSHKDHGMTGVSNRWPEAIVKLLAKYQIYNMIEFGPGNGKLALKTVKKANERGIKIKWSGVEIIDSFRREIKENFKKHNLYYNLNFISDTLTEIKIQDKSAAVLSYSLDSIPPDIFLNIRDSTFPTHMLGITVKNGILKEILLDKSLLKRKNITLKKGVYQKNNGVKVNLNNWNLKPYQRLFLSTLALENLIGLVNALPEKSLILIIDEFRVSPPFWEFNHLGVPRDLNTYRRDRFDLDNLYATSGENLLYYPFYYFSFLNILKQLELDVLKNDEEEKMANEISGKKSKRGKPSLTYSILAIKKIKINKNKIDYFLPNEINYKDKL